MIILRLLGPDMSLLVDRLRPVDEQVFQSSDDTSLSCDIRAKPIHLDQSVLPLLNGAPFESLLEGRASALKVEGPRRQDRYPIRMDGSDLLMGNGLSWRPIGRIPFAS